MCISDVAAGEVHQQSCGGQTGLYSGWRVELGTVWAHVCAMIYIYVIDIMLVKVLKFMIKESTAYSVYEVPFEPRPHLVLGLQEGCSTKMIIY